jgi:hypothetical protein
MGFDDADGVLNFMLKRANSFGTGVTDKTRVMCDLGEANDALPKGLVFDTILSDMSSLQFGVFGRGAVTGADVLKNLRTELRSEHMAFGTRRFVFCFDDRSYVTQAKMATQLERAAKAKQNPRTAPYENQIELAGADVSRTPLVGYSYALENKIPRDFARVMSTPTLLYKAIAFLCQLLATHFVNPCTVPIELVISGFRGQEADLSQTCTYLRRLAAGSLDANKLPVDTVVPDLEEPRMDAFCRVGESEGQCIYWVRKVLESSPPIGERRFLIRANDSDALAVALLNVPLFFRPGGSEAARLALVSLRDIIGEEEALLRRHSLLAAPDPGDAPAAVCRRNCLSGRDVERQRSVPAHSAPSRWLRVTERGIEHAASVKYKEGVQVHPDAVGFMSRASSQ